MEEKQKFVFDKLKLYFKEDHNIHGIIVRQPSIYDILHIGEKEFYQGLNLFVVNPTSIRLQLWKNGIDWNDITDFQLFCMLLHGIQQEKSENSVASLLFPNLSIKDLQPATKSNDEEGEVFVLKDVQSDLYIDEKIYMELANYVRTMFNIFPKEENVKGKSTKKLIIEEEQSLLEKRLRENETGNGSYLLPLVSFYTNHPGTKHTTSSLKEVGIYEFMDGIQQLQKYEAAGAVMKGMYSGFVDATKLNAESYNFIRQI